MANIRFYSLINEAASKCNIDAEKQCTQCNKKPIKVVQMISIQVVSKPTLLLSSATEFFNNGNKETAQETTDAKNTQIESNTMLLIVSGI